MMTYLILVRSSHAFNNLLGLRLCDATLLSHNLAKCCVDFPSHIRSVTTDVEVSLLLEELIDFFGLLQ